MLKYIKNKIRSILEIENIKHNQETIQRQLAELKNMSEELLKAQIFNNAIVDSTWLKNKQFAPSGWAMNYDSLYVLYNVLDKMKPQRILEFGLGQSSKIIYQYTAFFKDTFALTYENDEEWVHYFKEGQTLGYDINIRISPVEYVACHGYDSLTYKNNCEELKHEKFNLIIVDGPHGSEHYSRPQILNIVPHCLSDNFCILVHDSGRVGENETINELCNILSINNIDFLTRKYEAKKAITLITSPNNSFLLSI